MKINRRSFLQTSAALALGGLPAPLPAAPSSTSPLPVILATDIGDDIDDSWALGFLLQCPELTPRLVMTEYGKSFYRAKILAKFLQTTGHAQVPVAVGPDAEPRGQGPLAAWVKDYDLASYPGRVHTDGVGALIAAIMDSPRPVTLICIGPMPNIAAALEREPRLVRHARFVGMEGSVRLGYDASKTPCAEWNVRANPAAARKGLSADWDVTITPLDTCGLVTLEGARYQRILRARNPVASTVVENYRVWSQANHAAARAAERSTVLFDTVAVYLAFARHLCKMERLRLRVTDDGLTVLDNHAKKMEVATAWKNLDGFRDLLTARLCGGA
jgi:inosine-uridine nucleoside N-ribohydrolase